MSCTPRLKIEKAITMEGMDLQGDLDKRGGTRQSDLE